MIQRQKPHVAGLKLPVGKTNINAMDCVTNMPMKRFLWSLLLNIFITPIYPILDYLFPTSCSHS
jgi:hypothetical protein